MPEQKLGRITHYFSKIGVGVIELTDDDLSVGETIKIKTHAGEFDQTVTSMQIDHQDVANASKGQSLGLKVDQPVKEGDEVLKVME